MQVLTEIEDAAKKLVEELKARGLSAEHAAETAFGHVMAIADKIRQDVIHPAPVEAPAPAPVEAPVESPAPVEPPAPEAV